MARFPKRLALVLSFLLDGVSCEGLHKLRQHSAEQTSKLGDEVTCMIQKVSPHSGLEGIERPFATVQFHSDLGKNETIKIPVDGYPSYFQTGNSDLSQVCPNIVRSVIPDYNPNSHQVFLNPVK